MTQPTEVVSLAIADVYTHLQTRNDGLRDNEVLERQKQYGKNSYIKTQKNHLVLEFLSHLASPLVIILIIAACISFYVGEYIDGSIIAILVIFSAVLDFVQEHSAKNAAAALAKTVQTKATVIRDGKEQEIPLDEVVVGDIVRLSIGDIIPADARVIASESLNVNQSSLTGESYPVEKIASAITEQGNDLSTMNNIVFAGTAVTSGSGTAIVYATGLHTQFGKIAGTLQQREEQSTYDRGISQLSILLLKFTIILVIFIFFFNAFTKHDWLRSFIFAIAVTVGLIPELLPMILSVTMATGSARMAKKGAIVKKLRSIPTFGSMDVLCTDKTGTLTQDKIAVVNYVDPLGKKSQDVLLLAYLNSAHNTGQKNPLDEAVLCATHPAIGAFSKCGEIPFDFQRRRLSVVVETDDHKLLSTFKLSKGHCGLITKGAPEDILSISSKMRVGSRIVPVNKSKVVMQYQQLSSQGYRVLAVAIKSIKHQSKYTVSDESGLILIGFISFLDPPKPDVGTALASLKELNVSVKIITGDNEIITQRVCEQIGLTATTILLGSQVESMPDDALGVAAEKTQVFARCSPEQKNRIIRALQLRGHTVGYMGDGINDSPSLKTADVGISVNNAVDIAKESADIILTQKSLDILRDGVIEGRKTFANSLKYVHMGLSSNFGNMFSVLGAVLFFPFFPMLPIQILLNNLIYDFSQIYIPSDNVDESEIKKPQKWDMAHIKRFMLTFGPVSSLFDFITFFVLSVAFGYSAGYFQTGWFLESLATQTFVIHIIRTRENPFKNRASNMLLLSSLVCVIIGWIIPWTPLGKMFGFEHLSFGATCALILIVIMYLVTVEFVKRWFYRRYPAD